MHLSQADTTDAIAQQVDALVSPRAGRGGGNASCSCSFSQFSFPIFDLSIYLYLNVLCNNCCFVWNVVEHPQEEMFFSLLSPFLPSSCRLKLAGS